jgi:serine/threonine protein kinase
MSGPNEPRIKGYQVVRPLGHGGMGAVWLSRKEPSDELTALKVMLPGVAADQRSVMRFLQEINITRALRHPNVVRLIETGYQRGTFYLALDYCDGGSVGALLKARGSAFPVDDAVAIILQALDGLHYAHTVFGAGKPLIHRDLKPDNLFLAGSGGSRVAKIGDYGLAKALDDTGLSGLTRTGETAGTPFFMPRQQVLHFKNPTPDLDVWALAASLYQMLTRRPPRHFRPNVDRWVTVLETDAIPILKRCPTIPPRLAEVIDHALTEKPAIGFKTAAEFKKALMNAV